MLSKQHTIAALEKLGEQYHKALEEFRKDTCIDCRELPELDWDKHSSAFRSIDQALIATAQILDCIEGRKISGINDYRYRGSKMKAIRKGLGYNI